MKTNWSSIFGDSFFHSKIKNHMFQKNFMLLYDFLRFVENRKNITNYEKYDILYIFIQKYKYLMKCL